MLRAHHVLVSLGDVFPRNVVVGVKPLEPILGELAVVHSHALRMVDARPPPARIKVDPAGTKCSGWVQKPTF